MRTLLVIALAGLLPLSALAQDSVTLTYQGQLSSAAGTAVTASHPMTFKLYREVAGGEALWTELHGGVDVVDGVFSVDLGTITSLGASLSDEAALFLGVTVGDNDEMTPRVRVGGALKAQWAKVADHARDVRGENIHPATVSIGDTEVINAEGRWVGDPTGLVGPQGERGPAGAQGDPGPAGPAGAQGSAGDRGPEGPRGVQGEQGPEGPAGAQGEAGPAGPAGADGPAGPAGPAPDLSADSDMDGVVDWIELAMGTDPTDGADVPGDANGDGIPDAMVGPQGAQGIPGVAGAQGEAGPAGAQGPAGEPGVAGAQGVQGPAGNDGRSSLLRTAPEASGDNCANGGLRIDVGGDENGNGLLDDDEVGQSQYVCTPSPPELEQGPNLQTTISEVQLEPGQELEIRPADGARGVSANVSVQHGSRWYGAHGQNPPGCLHCGTGELGDFVAPEQPVLELEGGEYNYRNFIVPGWLTIKPIGDRPLIIKATGLISVNGIIDLSGAEGRRPNGGAGLAGGSSGGDAQQSGGGAEFDIGGAAGHPSRFSRNGSPGGDGFVSWRPGQALDTGAVGGGGGGGGGPGEDIAGCGGGGAGGGVIILVARRVSIAGSTDTSGGVGFSKANCPCSSRLVCDGRTIGGGGGRGGRGVIWVRAGTFAASLNDHEGLFVDGFQRDVSVNVRREFEDIESSLRLETGQTYGLPPVIETTVNDDGSVNVRNNDFVTKSVRVALTAPAVAGRD